MPIRIVLPLISLIVFSTLCRAQCPEGKVRLEAFTIDKFVLIKTQQRFHVTDIRVGNQSVEHLFRNPNTDQTTWLKGGYFREEPRPLTIKSGADLEKLHEILLDEGADTLTVYLADRHLTGWSGVPGLGSAIYQFECCIPVLCEYRTRLIYTYLSEITQERLSKIPQEQIQMEGETTVHLQVDEAFYKLLNEKLERYMKTLLPPEGGPCVDEIQLQKFLKTKGSSGFASGKYQLNEGLANFLNMMTLAMRNAAKAWKQYHLDVKILGHADRDEVRRRINLLVSDTGINDAVWRSTPSPLNVYFGGCNKNSLANKQPIYFDFDSPAQGNLISTITNNCELGAARAYVATAYLRSKFGTDSVSYSYATGGTKSADKTGLANPEDRRIEMEFTMKGARKGN